MRTVNLFRSRSSVITSNQHAQTAGLTPRIASTSPYRILPPARPKVLFLSRPRFGFTPSLVDGLLRGILGSGPPPPPDAKTATTTTGVVILTTTTFRLSMRMTLILQNSSQIRLAQSRGRKHHRTRHPPPIGRACPALWFLRMESPVTMAGRAPSLRRVCRREPPSQTCVPECRTSG